MSRVSGFHRPAVWRPVYGGSMPPTASTATDASSWREAPTKATDASSWSQTPFKATDASSWRQTQLVEAGPAPQAAASVSKSKRGSSIVLPGDWTCQSCGLNVFASRIACLKCGHAKPVEAAPHVAPAAAPQAPAASSSKSKRGSSIVLPGDWTCQSCGLNVFASRDACFKCGGARQDQQADGVAHPHCRASPAPTRFGDWECPSCGLNCFGSKSACFKCGARKPAGTICKGGYNARGVIPGDTASTAASDGRRSAVDSDTSSEPGTADCPAASLFSSDSKRYTRAAMLVAQRKSAQEGTDIDLGRLRAVPQSVLPPCFWRCEDAPVFRGMDNSWAAAQRVRRQAAGTGSASVDEEVAEIARKVKAILNKLTPEKFDVLSDQLAECAPAAEHLTLYHYDMLAEVIADEAIRQHIFAGMYGDLCVKLTERFGDPGDFFRYALWVRCWQSFDLSPDGEEAASPASALEASGFGPGADDEQAADSVAVEGLADCDDGDEKLSRRKRVLGFVRFMGELFIRGLFEPSDVICCAEWFLQTPVASFSVELAAAFLTVVGPSFDNEAWTHYSQLRGVFWQVRGLSFDRTISTRVRFLLRDLLELKDAGWKSTRGLAAQVEKPKRLEEVRGQPAVEGRKSKGGRRDRRAGGKEGKQATNAPSDDSSALRVWTPKSCGSKMSMVASYLNEECMMSAWSFPEGCNAGAFCDQYTGGESSEGKQFAETPGACEGMSDISWNTNVPFISASECQ